jgi:hypothetical protein
VHPLAKIAFVVFMHPVALDEKNSVLFSNCQSSIDVLAIEINISNQE